MNARYLTIEAKHRPDINYLSSLADFTVTAGEAVDADIVRDNSNISLYCLDDQEKQAIFVELPPHIDLATAPFVYQTQAEYAQRLIAVPYEAFRHVATTLPPVDHLIMVYMTGRSGSTLLSHIFNTLDNVLSLAEPDVGTQFVHLRSSDGSRDTELRELLDATVRFLFKPTAFKTPSIYALKLRNEATQVMDLYQTTFPQAKNLFLYRDAIGWVASFYRIFKMNQSPEWMPFDETVTFLSRYFKYDFNHLAAYIEPSSVEISLAQELTLWWLAVMEWYLAQYERGIPVLAVRYDELSTYREQVVSEIFRYCGLPPDKARSTLDVFKRDAQAGTSLGRENPEEGNKLKLSDEQVNQIAAILQHHPVVKEPGFVVPGTLPV
jgi:hypothetical protein